MMQQPDIIISSLDMQRLESLLYKLPDDPYPNKRLLEFELERAEVIESSRIPGNVVTMNSEVKFSVSSSNETFILTLVYPKDVKTDGSSISVLAPVGSAMLGLQEGDVIDWPNFDGKTVKVRIDKVLYQPERAGDFYR